MEPRKESLGQGGLQRTRDGRAECNCPTWELGPHLPLLLNCQTQATREQRRMTTDFPESLTRSREGPLEAAGGTQGPGRPKAGGCVWSEAKGYRVCGIRGQCSTRSGDIQTQLPNARTVKGRVGGGGPQTQQEGSMSRTGSTHLWPSGTGGGGP